MHLSLCYIFFFFLNHIQRLYHCNLLYGHFLILTLFDGNSHSSSAWKLHHRTVKPVKWTYQSFLQCVQVSSHVSQQEMQLVADDMDLLLGLHAVFSGGLQEELRGDLLQRGDLPLAAAQILLQSLQQGATESTAVSTQLGLNTVSYTDSLLTGIISLINKDQRRFYIWSRQMDGPPSWSSQGRIQCISQSCNCSCKCMYNLYWVVRHLRGQ